MNPGDLTLWRIRTGYRYVLRPSHLFPPVSLSLAVADLRLPDPRLFPHHQRDPPIDRARDPPGEIRLYELPQHDRVQEQELCVHDRCVLNPPRGLTRFSASYSDCVLLPGWVLTCVATGMEASAHMAEDTKKPSRTVPLAMFWSVVATYLMGWVSICVLLAVCSSFRSR